MDNPVEGGSPLLEASLAWVTGVKGFVGVPAWGTRIRGREEVDEGPGEDPQRHPQPQAPVAFPGPLPGRAVVDADIVWYVILCSSQLFSLFVML